MEPHVERNFAEYFLPLAGKGPHVCLHLGMQSPSHGAWLCRNVLSCTDDAYFGSCDFCGSVALYTKAVNDLAAFSNARVWPYPASQFLWDMPPMASAAIHGRGASMVYIDGSRDHAVFSDVLQNAWHVMGRGATCIINGHRTGRRRHELYPVVDDFFEKLDSELWEHLFDNRQFGFRKV